MCRIFVIKMTLHCPTDFWKMDPLNTEDFVGWSSGDRKLILENWILRLICIRSVTVSGKHCTFMHEWKKVKECERERSYNAKCLPVP